jgi:hypothetical protein
LYIAADILLLWSLFFSFFFGGGGGGGEGLKKRLPRATLILNIEIDIYINTNNIQTNTGDGLVIFFKYNKLLFFIYCLLFFSTPLTT